MPFVWALWCGKFSGSTWVRVENVCHTVSENSVMLPLGLFQGPRAISGLFAGSGSLNTTYIFAAEPESVSFWIPCKCPRSFASCVQKLFCLWRDILSIMCRNGIKSKTCITDTRNIIKNKIHKRIAGYNTATVYYVVKWYSSSLLPGEVIPYTDAADLSILWKKVSFRFFHA